MPDISIQSDLLIGVMNLIEMEHHARLSWLSTNDQEWKEKLSFAFELRSKYMKLLEREEDSQLHCWNKHELSSAFRLFEVGDKYLRNGEDGKAEDCYRDAYNLIGQFIKDNWSEKKENEKGGSFKLFK